jgi:hypothetical protein
MVENKIYTTKRILLKSRPEGTTVTNENFEILEDVQVNAFDLKEGTVMVKNIHLDFAPSLIARL